MDATAEMKAQAVSLAARLDRTNEPSGDPEQAKQAQEGSSVRSRAPKSVVIAASAASSRAGRSAAH